MGGGPSIRAALQTPEHAIYVSANDHGCRLFAAEGAAAGLRSVAYAVACDSIEQRIRAWPVVAVSRHTWADVRIMTSIAPNSGMTAAWFARLLGCNPIILAGMDCYGGGTYFDAESAKSTGRALGKSAHLTRWRALVARYPAQYRVAGAAPELAALLGRYDPDEPAAPACGADVLHAEAAGRPVCLLTPSVISRRPFPAGAVLEVSARDFELLSRRRRCRSVPLSEVPA